MEEGEVQGHGLKGDLSDSLSTLAVSSRRSQSDNTNDQTSNKLIQEEEALQQIQQREQEIIRLRKYLAEFSVKEARIQNEKYLLEKRIALLRKAFDQQQHDLVEATSKAISYRQDIIEENIRLAYALQAAQEEKSTFVSSLVPLLAEFSLHPPTLDAQSIVSNLRILFKHYKESLAMTEERLKESQYQPLHLHSRMKEQPLDNSSHSQWTQSNYDPSPNYAPSPETIDLGVKRERKDDAISSHFLPSILEEDPSSSSYPEPDDTEEDDDENDDDEDEDEDDENDYDKRPLPTIEGLQILGEAFPGQEVQASGYSKNGTTHCGFEWVRHLQDGSMTYIEGAKKPTYTVTADDVDSYLAVEVQPMDDRQRKGELVKCFANNNKKIACPPAMIREIEKTWKIGHASFTLSVWKGSLDIWEPATLEIKKNGYSIKLNGPNGGVLVDEKYTPATVIGVPAEIPVEFSIIGPGGVERYLRTNHRSIDVSCSRDTIVLTLRLFIKSAADRKLGKKKRRVLFFSK